MKSTMIIFIILGIRLFAMANSAEGGHGAEHESAEIPFSTIGYQAINLGLLLIGIFFAIRKSVAAMFQARYTNFNEQAKKTEEATKAAEVALSDIKTRIQNLQNTENDSVSKAQLDATEMKNKIIAEAKLHSEKLKSDTQMIVAAELINAKNEIRKEIINSSMEIAKNNIQKSAESITKKSENGFLTDLANTKTDFKSSVNI